jgi:UDP-N-acetyl-D-glucosamine/UDP-N-acetyl-D-galactosamine dehydrogenase
MGVSMPSQNPFLSAKDRTIAVIGLGYVGLPVAVEFGKKFRTIGFDLNSNRITELRKGYDKNNEVEAGELKQPQLSFTDSIEDLKAANFYIVAVPTPIDEAKRPDLRPILGASTTVGKTLKKGDIVVYESTVYPGVTEDECVPVLERISGLKGGVDFKVGYSPERINPGDKEHSLTSIKKIVAGQDEESLSVIAALYGSVVTAGIFKAQSIKVAEAAKVIENTQRDLNIALMNELAIIFDEMDIDTHAVLEAAGTKWNFLKFIPGLVGGHCIGVDPYYLTHKAEELNYHPQVILAGRRINDGMGKFIAQKTIKEMIHAGHNIAESRVTVLGLTFKENVRDLRNTRVIDIIHELEEYGAKVQVCDPVADPQEAKEEYGLQLVPMSDLPPADALIAAVAHKEFKSLTVESVQKLLKDKPVLVDIKNIFPRAELERSGIRTWRL